MSGGHFDYNQYKILEIVDSIERGLNKMGTPKPKDELWGGEEFYTKYPEEKYYQTYNFKVVEKMKEGIKTLKLAHIYAQRIDWFLSGDDGDESFLERLQNEINDLNNENNSNI